MWLLNIWWLYTNTADKKRQSNWVQTNDSFHKKMIAVVVLHWKTRPINSDKTRDKCFSSDIISLFNMSVHNMSVHNMSVKWADILCPEFPLKIETQNECY